MIFHQQGSRIFHLGACFGWGFGHVRLISNNAVAAQRDNARGRAAVLRDGLP
jgi:hypothetical protein